jgi:hypothetical protein
LDVGHVGLSLECAECVLEKLPQLLPFVRFALFDLPELQN